MLFWIIAALLTLAASLAVMQPFLRRRADAPAEVEHDLAVYRDQLAELEDEVSRGLISQTDAAEARAEIGRRILRLKDASAQEPGRAGAWRNRTARAVAVTAVLAVPVVAWGVYGLIGSPELPSRPLEARLQADPAEATLDELVARVEAHLAANPQDARGWETLAPIYARMGRHTDAANAFRRAIVLEGPNAAREAGLGEALVGQAGGIVTADAEAAFGRALALDSSNPRARFFTGMARAQEGETDAAQAIWQEMMDDLPEDSPWREAVVQAVAASDEMRAPALVGPSGEEIAVAENMSAEERRTMVEGMVASLDARLREDPADVEGWQRLVRSYVVLGRQEDAGRALERALAALGADSEQARAVAGYASTLGVSAGR